MLTDDLLYTKTHEWVKIEGNNVIVLGVTDYAQEQLGDIVGVELPEVDAEFGVEDPIGVIESVKSVSDIYCPVEAKVIAVNEELEDAPELINEDPYGKGWIAKFQVEDESQLDELMNIEQYQSYLEEE
jgi:glycine cleavage system H protein